MILYSRYRQSRHPHQDSLLAPLSLVCDMPCQGLHHTHRVVLHSIVACQCLNPLIAPVPPPALIEEINDCLRRATLQGVEAAFCPTNTEKAYTKAQRLSARNEHSRTVTMWASHVHPRSYPEDCRAEEASAWSWGADNNNFCATGWNKRTQRQSPIVGQFFVITDRSTMLSNQGAPGPVGSRSQLSVNASKPTKTLKGCGTHWAA